MKLKVIGSGSAGNCYIMTANNGENIIIEQGMHFKEITKALDYDFSKTMFGLCTHMHKDHSKSTRELMKAGIDVLMSKGEYAAEHINGFDHRFKIMNNGSFYQHNAWKVWAFNVNHDTPEPLGFVISHPECGKTLFLTDTYFISFKFPGLNNIIIEANFCEKIIQERFDAGYLHGFLKDRISKSHLSLSSCKDILKANDLSEVSQILLIHLSDTNSDSARFQSEVYEQTLKTVTVARPGLELNWNRTPFNFE